MMIFNWRQYQALPAIIDGDSGQVIRYDALDEAARKYSQAFENQKSLVFIFINSSVDALIAYLALLNQEHPVAVFDSQLHPDLKQQLIASYTPHYVIESTPTSFSPEPTHYASISTSHSSLVTWRCRKPEQCPTIHPELSLLLSTSGTTGSPKLIRLSKSNIVSNASSICSYLEITPKERAIASLPFHYSYGLSVLHSHIFAGASVVVTSQSMIQEGFWDAFNRFQCTSLAGVPYTYQLLDRLGLDNLQCPTLHTLTQAGGRLSPALVVKFHESMQKRKGRFFVMYGQTEATARVAYLPPSFLPAKAEAIGIAIPGGKLQLFDGDKEITTDHCEGELVYTGPNVMLGYATGPQDLAKGDLLHAVLHTGDLAYRDEDGIYFLTGRIKRISKVYGQRINLDEIERGLHAFGHIAATSDDMTIRLYYEKAKGLDVDACLAFLAKTYHLAPSTFECIAIEQFPLTASGKIDYTKLIG